MKKGDNLIRRGAWPIPANPLPGKQRCIVLYVPDEPGHLRAFAGAIELLSKWNSWQEVGGTGARDAARAWKEVIDNQVFFVGCDGKKIEIYEEYEEMVAFREDCDCNLFYKCCDGTEKQIALSSSIPAGSQPGAGSPQPAPNGGTVNYCAQMLATNKFLLPTVLNTGDTISLDISGAGNGGASDPLPLRWYCVDGQDFFAGACGGGTITSSLDPLPATPHFSMIINIGGTFYPFAAGLFTVPSGVVNQIAYIQVNDANLADNSGGYQICATVVNNQLGMWIADLDLTTNQHGLIATDFTPFPEPSTTTWVAGKGFVGSGGGFGDYTVGAVLLPISGSGFIDTIVATVYSEGHTGDNQLASYSIGGTVVSPTNDYSSAIVPSTNSPIDHTIAHTVALSLTPQWVKFDLYQNIAPFGDIVLSHLRITGRGFNPFA